MDENKIIITKKDDEYILKTNNIEIVKKIIDCLDKENITLKTEIDDENNLTDDVSRETSSFLNDNILLKLTKRETEILKMVSEGQFNKQIADKLGITERTVKNHIYNIFKKINVSDRTQAAIVYIKHMNVKNLHENFDTGLNRI